MIKSLQSAFQINLLQKAFEICLYSEIIYIFLFNLSKSVVRNVTIIYLFSVNAQSRMSTST